jgi:hypothetical protein
MFGRIVSALLLAVVMFVVLFVILNVALWVSTVAALAIVVVWAVVAGANAATRPS